MTCVQTQTSVLLQSDTMAGFTPQTSSRTKAAASRMSNPNHIHGISGFSCPQTVPIPGQNSGSFWNAAGEGQQYLNQESLIRGSAQNGFEYFDTYPVSQESQTGMRRGQSQWSGDNVSTKIESQNMSHLPTQDSIGAHCHRTHHSALVYDQSQNRTMMISQDPVQGSFLMSSARSDVKGRSISPEDPALCASAQTDIADYDYSFSGEDMRIVSPVFQRNSTGFTDAQLINTSTGPTFSAYATSVDEPFPPAFSVGTSTLTSQGPVPQESLMYNPGMIMDSSTVWDNGVVDFLESRRSSPTAPEDTWPISLPMMTPATNSPVDSPPSLEAISPKYTNFSDVVELPPYTTGDRVTRKPMGPRQSKVVSDNARHQCIHGASEISDESFKLGGRSSLDVDNTARDHPLYQNVFPGADGLYHCPWEVKSSCQHKPEKLKCNYDKFVDSHLKPYRCKVRACENLHFSSTACLLRHEREAHAMHGHGDRPFLCTYEGCERAVAPNGFPRHWNLRDHMKRVHNDSNSGSPPPSGPARGKKRKADEKPETTTVEKALKRVNSPPVVVHQQPREPNLLEQYQEDFQKLLDTVGKLQDPKDSRLWELMATAFNTIGVMHRTASRINEAPVSGQKSAQQLG